MMTLEQLNQHHAQIHQVLAQEIKTRQTNSARPEIPRTTTTLAQLEAAMGSLNALREEMATLLAGKAKEPVQRPMLVDTRSEYHYR